jgi:hypothetical protein
VAALFQLLQVSMMLAPVPVPLHDMFSSASICMANVMVCRVFRHTQQIMRDPTVNVGPEVTVPTARFASSGVDTELGLTTDQGKEERSFYEIRLSEIGKAKISELVN